MPCLVMHLAIAKKYLKIHPEENYNEFILGTIAPDIDMEGIENYINGVTHDKNSHHFGENYQTTDVIEYMQKKVNFEKFFEENNIDTSFKRAYFLHLLADYYFFGKYITHNDLIGKSLMEVVKIGFNDYDLITPIIIEKYDLDLPPQLEFLNNCKGKGDLQLLNLEEVFKFIEDMSMLDIISEKKNFSNIEGKTLN